MSNIIFLHRENSGLTQVQQETFLQMSNGGTGILLESMVLSGSRLAATPREKELIIWLAEHDQNVFGGGTVGFALSEMPFSLENFEQEKDFLRRVLAGVEEKLGWDTWDASPNEEFLKSFIGGFRSMLELLEPKRIDPTARDTWKAEHLDRTGITEARYKKEYEPSIEWYKKNCGEALESYEEWAEDSHRQVDRAERVFAQFPICEIHGVLETPYGCIICNGG